MAIVGGYDDIDDPDKDIIDIINFQVSCITLLMKILYEFIIKKTNRTWRKRYRQLAFLYGSVNKRYFRESYMQNFHTLGVQIAPFSLIQV